MTTHLIDLEKQPVYSAIEASESPVHATSAKDPLLVYQVLVGDVYAPNDSKDDSVYHNIVYKERRSRFMALLTGVLFGILVATQIVLCLGIAIGAQTGVKMLTISILAGVNTGVAASIAVLKGLGLPEKKIVEMHKLGKLAEKIRFTTRRLKAGLDVDAAAAADEAVKAVDEVEDEAIVLPNVGDAKAKVPTPDDSKAS
ncbi:hypothetical protein LTR62_000733 [Meristemomyces frigidus]|uniref:SMODS and SLOG-associating 2TM effector domain-containing protein n=1 Tax=Meristemomyces frigidus TaxID=1508187 RepID=A0AAN7T9W6_9PEZI|nr:hypothetical protein LTR62_000733 [Meristemomyces frigidus]